MDLNEVIIQPVITEQSMVMAGKHKYTFFVAKSADKDQIKKAIEKKFNVSVLQVSSQLVKGRSYRSGPKRIEKTKSPMKKAVVTVKKGEKIALFDIKS